MSYQQGQVTLPAIYVGRQPSAGKDEIGGGFGNNLGKGFSPAPGAMEPIFQHLTQQTVTKLDTTVEALNNEYWVNIQTLPQAIEDELAAVRAEGANHPLPPVEAIQRELHVRNTLLLRKTAEFHIQTALANAFYGADPINRSTMDFFARARRFAPVQTPDGKAVEQWTRSYKAAWSARLLNEKIQLLNQQHAGVQNFLAAVQNDEHTRQVAQQEAQRVAAELARLAAEAEARRIVAEQERIAALAQEQRLANEQAQLAALAEAQRLANEQAKAAAEAAAQHAAAEQARLEALAEVQRQAEQQRLEREQQEAQKRAQEKANRQPPTLTHSGSMAAIGPVFTATAGSVVTNPATSLALKNTLRTAVSAAIAALATSATPIVVGFAALLTPSKLNNGDLYTVSVPLSELAPEMPDNLYELAAVQGEVNLKVTLASRAAGNQTQVVVATTDGVSVPATVPVRLARFDSQRNVYVSTSAGPHTITTTWTPVVELPPILTELPVSEIAVPIYAGATVTPGEGRIDAFPQLDQYSFGGFITVFPIDSGIPPIYTMFRDRRDEPGVASGYGQAVSGAWLGAASQGEGAAIPPQIADKLRGREFSNFNAFRKAFWKTVAADQQLSAELSHISKIETLQGLAARAPQAGHVGKRQKFELHHVIPINEGGAVFDADNLRILTPKQHIETHSYKGEK
ncbi:S-type pyocin domain-containing protein [Pseudomonas sp. Irchel s3b6]|uniref:S-type pyocin domain-containing protein n=1 Tax=Pseudomonas sp. Irchel s3b6 TaxID=2009078 RepID=UPI0021145550|nr:S-type pyocin domain-containing protein [Pseudomonas sp. Irchel s3b6]